jgi:DNA-binding NtrC family response regulator
MAEPTQAQSQYILALVNDLFFLLKIEDTAKHLGWPIRFASTVPELLARLQEGSPVLLIADLTIGGEDLAPLFEHIHTSPQQATSPILGYTTHADWKRTAPLHDKCTTVVTKDTLSRSLPTLMQQLIRQGEA